MLDKEVVDSVGYFLREVVKQKECTEENKVDEVVAKLDGFACFMCSSRDQIVKVANRYCCTHCIEQIKSAFSYMMTNDLP